MIFRYFWNGDGVLNFSVYYNLIKMTVWVSFLNKSYPNILLELGPFKMADVPYLFSIIFLLTMIRHRQWIFFFLQISWFYDHVKIVMLQICFYYIWCSSNVKCFPCNEMFGRLRLWRLSFMWVNIKNYHHNRYLIFGNYFRIYSFKNWPSFLSNVFNY